ncbi:MAG: FMN-binding glutamate synthase family protein [Nitrospirae bacterium]|nr:FMN-binding glutamate synthase family protein [Nitrospirota bacterium]
MTSHWLTLSNLALTAVMLVTPLLVLGYIYARNRAQHHHSLLRKHPLLGVFRYLIEKVGPELRFYITDGDNDGRPLSRAHFTGIIMAAKYCKSIIGFGSKRDFSLPGFYLANTMFPKQADEVRVDNSTEMTTQRYVVDKEGIFTRKEHKEALTLHKWLLPEADAIVIGPARRQPFVTRAWFGCSAMSYGALGGRAHEAINRGLAMSGAGWHNTGEGGVSPFHLKGADVIAQIGTGKFGYRTDDGRFSEAHFLEKAAMPQIRAFEIKLAQGAKIKGGHLEGSKVTPEVAAIRGVKVWTRIDSPNRFDEFHDVPSLMAFVERLQELGGKPVGIKVVIGSDLALVELAQFMAETGKGPDFITVDGGEGGSGASYREMADTMGLPINSGLVIADDTLRRHGVRGRVKLIASGKLHSADHICIALGLGADAVNIARGFMIAVGCIMTEKCHTGKCPVGVATTDPAYEDALVVDEKLFRVANYAITLRAGCYSLAAACGLESPLGFTREHVVFKDAAGHATRASVLFPYPDAPERPANGFIRKPLAVSVPVRP